MIAALIREVRYLDQRSSLAMTQAPGPGISDPLDSFRKLGIQGECVRFPMEKLLVGGRFSQWQEPGPGLLLAARQDRALMAVRPKPKDLPFLRREFFSKVPSGQQMAEVERMDFVKSYLAPKPKLVARIDLEFFVSQKAVSQAFVFRNLGDLGNEYQNLDFELLIGELSTCSGEAINKQKDLIMLNRLTRFVQLQHKCVKHFDLHEYQSKDLMRRFNIRVQKGEIALTPEDAAKVAATLDPSGGLILKAQVHAGGRGKGHLTSGLKGGVKICKTPSEVANFTKQMIGYNLITHQTPKDGLKVNAVLVHEGVDIVRQIYLAFILDRNTQRPAIVASINGGMEIEEVAKSDPKSIIVRPLEVDTGLTDKIADEIIDNLQLQKVRQQAREQMRNLYTLFQQLDATQLEINPWATDPKEQLFCIDAKINIDDNAKFRQKELVELRKNSLASEQVDPHEELALAAGLNYVALDGNIGCMVNGAGLAMATMDIIKLYGGEPANFLDVGGGANVEQVKTAFEILNSHPKVHTILINIFGGIMKCNIIAEGIIKAAQLVNLRTPLVVRLTGTNSKEGAKMLEDFAKTQTKVKITTAVDLDDAAQKSVKIVKASQK